MLGGRVRGRLESRASASPLYFFLPWHIKQPTTAPSVLRHRLYGCTCSLHTEQRTLLAGSPVTTDAGAGDEA